MARAVSARTSSASVVGPTTKLRGRITGDGDLQVEGSIEGEVSVSGQLKIGEAASVSADVQAASVEVDGSLNGDIQAGEAVRIGAGAHVQGTIRGASVSVAEGATISGRIEVDFELPAELVSKGGR